MKRKNNLFIKNVTYENIYKEYKNVKSSCRSQRKLFDFAKNLHINLLDIERKLICDEYKFDKPFLFLIREPKYRIIMSESISDKIVNHFIADYLLLPVIDKSLIETNVATRKNRRASLCYNYLERYLSCLGINNKIYALKVDISKYFYNIDHNLLKEMIKRKIKDKRALKIINEVIDLTCRENINKEIENLIKNEKIE